MLKLTHISHRYGDHAVLREFELTTLELTEEDYAEIKRRRDEIVEEDARRREAQRAKRLAQTEAEG